MKNLNHESHFKINTENKLIPSEEPLYDMDEINGIVSSDSKKPFDVREIIARVFDGSK